MLSEGIVKSHTSLLELDISLMKTGLTLQGAINLFKGFSKFEKLNSYSMNISYNSLEDEALKHSFCYL